MTFQPPVQQMTTGVTIETDGRWLVVRFPGPRRALSWAIVGGGFRTVSAVVWHQVDDDELSLGVDARTLLLRRLEDRQLLGVVALLTSAPLACAVRRTRRAGSLTVDCLATVGLGNALRVGDPVAPTAHLVGTINSCVWISQPLTDEGFVEAQALCAEARTLAVLGAAIPSVQSALPATGTGTDCQVVVAPPAEQSEGGATFAGKHTVLGQLIGSVVADAVKDGITRWLGDRGKGVSR